MELNSLLRLSAPKCTRCHFSPKASSILSPRRRLTTTRVLFANEKTPKGSFQHSESSDSSIGSISALGRFLGKVVKRDQDGKRSNDDLDPLSLSSLTHIAAPTPPHHLHVYATKHNTHLTLTRPDRNPIISVSAGNIGFRKSNRGTYDAAYQLGAYMMSRIQDQGLLTEIQKLELVLRGFGPGREAISKILLGSEGMNLRSAIVKVTDGTRLKFGGTRSKKPRRLG